MYSSLKDNICDVDLADMQSISNYSKGIRFLLCVIDLFSKYAWVVPLKNKQKVTIVNAFQSILDSSKRKPKKVWINQGSEFYNSHLKNFFRGYEYNNTYHRTIKMKPIDVKGDTFAEYNEESNEKDPKLKIGDNVRISKQKKFFAKGYTPNWSEKVFVTSY